MTTKIKQTGIADNAVGHAQMVDNAIGHDEMRNDSVGTNEIIDAAVTTAKIADEAVTTAKIAAAARPILTKSYSSGEQTITTAGTLSLTHGLGEAPKMLRVTLVCKTTQGNYAVDDEVEWGLVGDAAADRGVVLVPNTTTIYVRYANNATVFGLPDKTTGTTLNLTNANWRMVVRAWA